MLFDTQGSDAMLVGLIGALSFCLVNCGSQKSTVGWKTNPPESCSSDSVCSKGASCNSEGQCTGGSERQSSAEPQERLTDSAEALAYAGFTNPEGFCAGTNGESGEVKLRFALAEGRESPQQDAEPSNRLNASDVSLENTVFHSHPTRICNSASDCGTENFMCSAPQSREKRDNRHCIGEADVQVEKVIRRISDEDHFFGVVMENSGSLQGWRANQIATTKHYDYCTEENGTCRCEQRNAPCRPDGTTDTPPATSQTRAIATDNTLARIAHLKRMEPALNRAAKHIEQQEHKLFFGLWSFSNEDKPSTHVPYPRGWSDRLTEDVSVFDRAIDEFEQEAGTVNQNRANIYEATKQVIKGYYAKANLRKVSSGLASTFEKTLVLFVDGPDDLRNADETTIDQLISLAENANVRIFAFQLDPSISDQRVLRDDPVYYREQAPCSSDRDCKNFETCRIPRRYGPKNGPVEEPQVPSSDARFCLPDRGPQGRIGPIAGLARLGCATGGGYKYLTNEDSESRREAVHGLRQLHTLPYLMTGLWEATVTSPQLKNDAVPDEDFVSIGGQLNVVTDGFNQMYTFSPVIEEDNGSTASSGSFLRVD